jgi:hypothetical protein
MAPRSVPTHSIRALVAKIEAAAQGRPWRPSWCRPLMASIYPPPGDGKRLATRATGRWRDAKGLPFYLLAEDRFVQVLSWHQVPTEEETVEALRQIKAAGLISEEQVRLCMIANGARWSCKVGPRTLSVGRGDLGLRRLQ